VVPRGPRAAAIPRVPATAIPMNGAGSVRRSDRKSKAQSSAPHVRIRGLGTWEFLREKRSSWSRGETAARVFFT